MATDPKEMTTNLNSKCSSNSVGVDADNKAVDSIASSGSIADSSEVKKKAELVIAKLRELSTVTNQENDKLDGLLLLVLFPNKDKNATITQLVEASSADEVDTLKRKLDEAEAAVPKYQLVLVSNR